MMQMWIDSTQMKEKGVFNVELSVGCLINAAYVRPLQEVHLASNASAQLVAIQTGAEPGSHPERYCGSRYWAS